MVRAQVPVRSWKHADHAARRWADAVISVVEAQRNPRTLEMWAHHAASAPGTLRAWCRAAGVPAKKSLDFARVLRAVVIAQRDGWDPLNLLDIIDIRTLRTLLSCCGLEKHIEPGQAPSLQTFLEQQRIVSNKAMLEAIVNAMDRSHLLK